MTGFREAISRFWSDDSATDVASALVATVILWLLLTVVVLSGVFSDVAEPLSDLLQTVLPS